MNRIESVSSVSGCGAFSTVAWDAPSASRYNLVYGWNASGKTTLGRIIRILDSESTVPGGFEQVCFRMAAQSGTITESDRENDTIDVRVYNEDFVEQNLAFDSGAAKPIVILGKASVELKDEIGVLEEEANKLGEKVEGVQQALESLPDIDKILTTCGKRVVEEFAGTPLAKGRYSGRRYRRPEVADVVAEEGLTEEGLANHVIDDPVKLETLRETVRGTRSPVSISRPRVEGLQDIFAAGNALLGKSIEVTTIDRLESDREVRDWVGVGYDLHVRRELDSCLFCQGELDEEHLERYGDFYTDEVTEAETGVRRVVEALEDVLTGLDPELPDSSVFFPDIAEEYVAERETLEGHLRVIQNSCRELLQRLERRSGQMHEEVSIEREVEFPERAIVKAMKSLDRMVGWCEEQNDRLEGAEEKRASAARGIELHIVASVLKREAYFRHRVQRRQLMEQQEKLRKRWDEVDRSLTDKRASLRDTRIAVEEINRLVGRFLGPDEVELRSMGEDQEGYHVLNRGERTEHLSEGEKSVVALAYFLVKLREEGVTPEETVVVLDDPVDSQDGNFLFRTVGLLRRRLSDMGQLFIFTHNFDLFNLIRDWFQGYNCHEESEMYLIEMDRGEAERELVIRGLPDVLRRHKTEYQYLFGRLVAFQDDPTTVSAPLIPNIARKVLEYFASFKWSCTSNERLSNIVHNRFITSADRREQGVGDAILKFVHEYSHGREFSRPISASVMEAEAVCDRVLEFIYIADKTHYNAVKKEVGGA